MTEAEFAAEPGLTELFVEEATQLLLDEAKPKPKGR